MNTTPSYIPQSARLSAILLISALFSLFACSKTNMPDSQSSSNTTSLIMKTSEGELHIELFSDKAPISVKNFVDYVNSGFFDGLIFHRVIPGFVIQGGGFDANMGRKETNTPIVNEADNGLRNLRGTLSMARTSNPDSATSQFFINLRDNAALDQRAGQAGYAVFGKVSQGMDVVDRIAAVPTANKGPHSDVPQQPVIMESVRLADK